MIKVEARRGGCVKHEHKAAGNKKTDIWRARHAHRRVGRQTDGQTWCRSEFNLTINCNSHNRVRGRQELWLKAPKAIFINP